MIRHTPDDKWHHRAEDQPAPAVAPPHGDCGQPCACYLRCLAQVRGIQESAERSRVIAAIRERSMEDGLQAAYIEGWNAREAKILTPAQHRRSAIVAAIFCFLAGVAIVGLWWGAGG